MTVNKKKVGRESLGQRLLSVERRLLRLCSLYAKNAKRLEGCTPMLFAALLNLHSLQRQQARQRNIRTDKVAEFIQSSEETRRFFVVILITFCWRWWFCGCRFRLATHHRKWERALHFDANCAWDLNERIND